MRKSKTILIVEDEPATLRSLRDEIVSDGFDALTAEDGEAGLALALKEHPDIILLDVMMPKMTGIEVMKHLRKDPWGAKVPIIVLTRLSPDEKIMKEIYENEPSFYLLKQNWTVGDVVQRIKDCFGDNQGRQNN